jgi:hypothetical protein
MYQNVLCITSIYENYVSKLNMLKNLGIDIQYQYLSKLTEKFPNTKNSAHNDLSADYTSILRIWNKEGII